MADDAATGALSDLFPYITHEEGMPPMRSIRLFLALVVVLVGTISLSLVGQARVVPTSVLEASAQGKSASPMDLKGPPSVSPTALEGITVYLNRPLFVQTYPTLPFENFGDAGADSCIGLTALYAPLNSQSSNLCFNTGDILPGIELRDNPINGDDGSELEGLVYAPPGAGGVTNTAVTGNHFTNTFEIIFTPTAHVIGLDLVTLYGEDSLRIRLFAEGDQLHYETTIPAVGPQGYFMGFETEVPIERVELWSAGGAPGIGSEGVSGLFFGSPNREISLDVTVGTDPHTCSDNEEITVLPGTKVTYCYRLTNNTPLTLSTHTLTDTVFGTLLNQALIEIAPGASYVLTASNKPLDNDTNTARWSATTPLAYTTQTGSCRAFPDISSTGQPLNLGDDDFTDVSLPMAFPFYDTVTDKIQVVNNGLIVVEDTADGIPTQLNFPLPTTRLPRAIAPFWDDLTAATGNVYVGPYTFTEDPFGGPSLLAPEGSVAGPLNYYAIEWYQRLHAEGPNNGTPATFTVLLAYPGQGMDGYLVTCYQDTSFGSDRLDYGASATIGINQSATNGQLYIYNTAQPELHSNFGVGYVAAPSGSYVATDSATVIVFNSDIDVTPLSLEAVHSTAPQSTVLTLTLTNMGDDPVLWNMYEAFNQCTTKNEISWLSSDVTSGALPRGGQVVISNTFSSAELPDGTYSAQLCIRADGVSTESFVVPVTLQVQGSPAEAIQLYLPVVRRR